MPAPGSLLKRRYRIVRQLAQGGMGVVYEAIDRRLQCQAALKECYVSGTNQRRAFEREARLLGSLRHPALPKATDYFTAGGRHYLVMEFIPGDDLAAILKQQASPFSADRVLRWADELLDALEYMHSQVSPVIHRDIKPQNLKLTGQDQIILLDFGISKGAVGHPTQAGTIIHAYTPHYSPPEQIRGEPTDERSDLYALGATLYHLLTGRVPIGAETRLDASSNRQGDPLQSLITQADPPIPPYIAEVIEKACSLDAKERWHGAAEMRIALRDDRTTVVAPKTQVVIDRVVKQSNGACPHFNSGKQFLKSGEYYKAIYDFRKSIRRKECVPASWFYVGLAHYKLGNHNGTITPLHRRHLQQGKAAFERVRCGGKSRNPKQSE